MSGYIDLPPVPAARSMPPGRFEERRSALVHLVELELRHQGLRPARLRRLRARLAALLALLALIAAIGSSAGAGGAPSPREAVEVGAALGSAQVAISLAALPRVRPRLDLSVPNRLAAARAPA